MGAVPHLGLIFLRGAEDDSDPPALWAVSAVEAFAFGMPNLHVVVDELCDFDQEVRAFLRCPASRRPEEVLIHRF